MPGAKGRDILGYKGYSYPNVFTYGACCIIVFFMWLFSPLFPGKHLYKTHGYQALFFGNSARCG